MKFEIAFNQNFNDDAFLIELGAYYVPTGSNKYPPFEVLMMEIKDFEELEKLLEKVDKKYNDYYSAVISFDNPTIYLDNKV